MILFHLPNLLCNVHHFKVCGTFQVENKSDPNCRIEDEACHGEPGCYSATGVRLLKMYSM